MSKQKRSEDGTWKDLDEAADRFQSEFDRLAAKMCFIAAGIASIITLILLLTGHTILFALCGFGTMIAMVIGLIKLIPHKWS